LIFAYNDQSCTLKQKTTHIKWPTSAITTEWSKKQHKVYDAIILQSYVTESCGYQQNVLKETAYDKRPTTV